MLNYKGQEVDIEQLDIEQRLVAIERIISADTNEIANEAEQLAATFWEHRDNLLEIRSQTGSTPILGCRVQRTNDSVTMSWFYMKFYISKSTNTKRRTNVHIKKPKKGGAYTISKLLKYASPAQENIVKITEESFTELRQRLEVNRKIKQQLYYYKEAAGFEQ